MIPHLFKKVVLPSTLPKILDNKIKDFSLLGDKEDFLRKSFFFIVNNWGGARINMILRFSKLLEKDIYKIIESKGYMHCTTMNYLLRTMAVKSGLFNDDDIKIKLTHTWYIAPHQYLEITISKNKKMILDPWNYQYGIQFGDFGVGFDSIRIRPLR